MRQLRLRPSRNSIILILFIGASLAVATGQSKTIEREFPQPSSAVQKMVQNMQGAMSGHLPILDGFAVPGDHPFERYQRAYFQATAKVIPIG